MSEVTAYGGIPYAEGSLFGIRAFRVDALGRLVASTRNEVWEPGENLSRHGSYDRGEPVMRHKQIPGPMAKDEEDAIRAAGATGKPDVTATKITEQVTSWQDPLMGIRTREIWHVSWMDDDHSPAACDSCGFHGFTEPDAKDYESYDSSVVGVIEGYGKLTHGTRGFRADKAKVVALLAPTGSPREEDTRGRFARAMWWRARHPGLVFFLMLALIALTVVNGMLRRYDVTTTEVFALVALAISGLLLANAVCSVLPPSLVVRKWGPPGAEWKPNHRRKYREPADLLLPHEQGLLELEQARLAERFELVKRNYPDVEIFTDREAMTKKFGVAPVPPPPPPTPATTDGFWSLPVESLD